jgi:hypothetical protein
MCFDIVKVVYDKLIANIILSRKKLNPFPLRSRISQTCSLSPMLFNIVFEFLARARERIQKDTNRKERNQTIPVCRWFDTILRKSGRFQQKTLRSDKHFQQSCRMQNQHTEIQ